MGWPILQISTFMIFIVEEKKRSLKQIEALHILILELIFNITTKEVVILEGFTLEL